MPLLILDVSILASVCGAIPAGLVEQRQPVLAGQRCLEYEIYGKFKFDYEPDGVYALGRQWVPIEEAALCAEWEDKKDAFEQITDEMSAPFESA